MRTTVALGFGFLMFAAYGSASDRDFSLTAEPLFLGTDSPSKVQPYALIIENRGRDTSGVVTLEANDFSMRYPVNLPQGSRKRIVAYMTGGNYFDGIVTLRTPQGGAQFRIESRPSGNEASVAVVSDAGGELGFLRTKVERQAPTAVDLYIKPDLMPDRTAAYAGVSAVWLGDGSERMNDESAAALRRYVSAGGTVVVSGGASMPLMGDPRWRPLLPVTDARPRTIQLDSILWGVPVQGECTVGVGSIAPGARTMLEIERVPLVVELRHGLGRVLYIAFNMTEGPARQWLHREAFLKKMGIPGPTPLGQLIQFANPDPYGGGISPSSYSPQADSPFSANVPETSTVVGILLLYFIIVVPVNLIALRKIGKGEWAWITSPIISLAFAAVFFRFSSNLYSSNLSVASNGVLVLHKGDPEATYIGHNQLFFPSGGRYDLRLEGVEAVFTQERYTGNPNQVSTMASLDMLDDGQVRAPDSAVTNLAFREFSVFQRVPATDLLTVRVKRVGGKVVAVEATNRSSYSMQQTGVILVDGSYELGDLKPGETKSTKRSGYLTAEPGPSLATAQVVAANLGSGRAKQSGPGDLMAVTALVSGFRAGPRLGKAEDNLDRNWLIYTLREGNP